MKTLNPAEWAKPKGYANGVAAEGRFVFVAGQIGWTAEARFESDDLVDQTRQALRNIVRVLAEAGARPEHVVRMTWYVVDKKDYLARNADLGKVYREIMGRHYPAMTLVQVAALLEDRAKIEIEATAVLPPGA
ncbi:MAG: RidA family protein [Ferrovibrio sp.]|jgi:enamine deaminase RidA (YjgF/YER057c/UK114 family)|uniref:RidA family protein n=1 Tax=Ferrovibrio sp. TaxID=1917215 RepID=UPI00391952F1